MVLLVPLVILVAALALAWGMGVLARGKSTAVWWLLSALGVCVVFMLPLIHDAYGYDGNCYALDGASSPCTLGERLWQSFASGFGFMIPPALMWLATFTYSSRQTS